MSVLWRQLKIGEFVTRVICLLRATDKTSPRLLTVVSERTPLRMGSVTTPPTDRSFSFGGELKTRQSAALSGMTAAPYLLNLKLIN